MAMLNNQMVVLKSLVFRIGYHLVLTNTSPWKDPPILKFGKPSISMGHGFHGYVSHNQRVLID